MDLAAGSSGRRALPPLISKDSGLRLCRQVKGVDAASTDAARHHFAEPGLQRPGADPGIWRTASLEASAPRLGYSLAALLGLDGRY